MIKVMELLTHLLIIFYVSNLTMVLFLNRKNNLKHSNGHPKPLKSLLIKQNSGTLCSFKSHHKYCSVFSKRNIDIWIELQCILAAVKRLPNWQISKFRVWKKNAAWHTYEAQSLHEICLEPELSDFFQISNFDIWQLCSPLFFSKAYYR